MTTETSGSLGAVIDQLYAARESRLDLERKVKIMKEEESALRNKILEMLADSGLAKASGGLATAGRRVTTIPLVTDWPTVFNYIKENDRFDLVQKRISVLAWRETIESGIIIPGTESVEDIDITLTKSSRS